MNRQQTIRLLCASLGAIAVGSANSVSATGTGQGGRDVYHVPMSWCAVQGSPAAANPNIIPIGSVTADTNTDALLWRRHERPTDNILLPQADITLRSAINDVWGTLNFPIIADPTPGGGQQQGDVRGEDTAALGAGSEYATLIQNCDAAWANLGRAGVGITAININLFHDAADNYGNLGPTGNWLGFPIGWGGCTRQVGSNTCRNTAADPYDGRIMVADNQYFYPTVADRTLPPSPNDPGGNIQYISDPFDQLVGHEVGHALGLRHNTATTDLMFGTSTDNSGNGQVDNIALDNTEITTLRASALNVPSVQIDPPQQINPGDFSAMTLVDNDKDETDIAAHADLTSVKAIINKTTEKVFINVRVRGVTPAGGGARFWVTLDANRATALPLGADDELPRLPFDADTADTVFMVDTSPRLAKGKAWSFQDGQVVEITDRLDFQLRRLTMYPYYGSVVGQQPVIRSGESVGIYDVVTIVAPAPLVGVQLNAPFLLNAAARAGSGPVDVIQTDAGKDLEFTLEEAHLPKCFADGPAKPGLFGRIRVEGLSRSEAIHALIGPREVYRGVTDADGNTEFDLPVPFDTTDGLHLVTVGVDGTAFTADCVIMIDSKLTVPPPGKPPGACCERTTNYLIVIVVLVIVAILILLMILSHVRRR